MEDNAESRKEITLETGEANVKAMIFMVPALISLGIPYALIWGTKIFGEISDIIFHNVFILLIFIILGALMHELIHGFFWSLYTKNGFKSIKFGVAWQFLTPYCHCREALKLKHYRLGAIMPCIILGIIPSLVAISTGNTGLFLFGFFFSVAAGGDMLMLWMLRKENKNVMVQDHPEKIGCTILT